MSAYDAILLIDNKLHDSVHLLLDVLQIYRRSLIYVQV